MSETGTAGEAELHQTPTGFREQLPCASSEARSLKSRKQLECVGFSQGTEKLHEEQESSDQAESPGDGSEQKNAELVTNEDGDSCRINDQNTRDYSKRESHDEAFWYKLCERYKKYQEQNPDKNVSQRSFLKSGAVAEVTGEPKDCRSFSRYWKRYELGQLNPSGTKKRRRSGSVLRKMSRGYVGISFTMPKPADCSETDPRPPPKLLPLRTMFRKSDDPNQVKRTD